MNKNGLDIQTIFNKRTDKLTDRVLLSKQVTIEKAKANPLHFFKNFIAKHTNGIFGFARSTSPTFAKPQEPFFNQSTTKYFILLLYNLLMLLNRQLKVI